MPSLEHKGKSAYFCISAVLVIVAVCIESVPNGVTKRIENFVIFAIAIGFAIFAHVWLIIALIGASPGEIEIWEGLLSLIFFAVLIVTAWIVDKKFLRKMQNRKTEETTDGELTEPLSTNLSGIDQRSKPWTNIAKEFIQQYANLTIEELAKLVAATVESQTPHDRLYYRIRAVRWLSGSLRSLRNPVDEFRPPQLKSWASKTLSVQSLSSGSSTGPTIRKGTIEFAAKFFGFNNKDAKSVKMRIIRRNRLHKRVFVRYSTLQASADPNQLHYVPKSDLLVFHAGEECKGIQIDIKDNVELKENQGFFVDLRIEEGDAKTEIGTCAPAVVLCQNSEEPCQIYFEGVNFVVKQSAGYVRLPVQRKGCIKGQVVVAWETREGTAHGIKL